ncbi:MAG: Spi family protease inhibitor [Muribaculaceae bacterium]|nr:Spi family protease inhibitor [Muribaculaceae bacterium]
MPDTLAYIINYANNGGFAIIASDFRVNPVLAFSSEGRFNYENEMIQLYFLNRIEPYMTYMLMQNNTFQNFKPEDLEYGSCVSIEPHGAFGIHQYYPYNKYIVEELYDMDYPAGCVTVATAMVLLNTKWKLDYHGTTYHMYAINDAIKYEPVIWDAPKRIFNGEDPVFKKEITYTSEEAEDLVAKLMYWLSKDLNIEYGKSSNGDLEGRGKHTNARDFLKKIGLDIPADFQTCDIYEMAKYLDSGHILYMYGYTPNLVGHDWICDGWRYCYYMGDKNNIVDVYLHFDWGWGDPDTTYYSGSIFQGTYSMIDVGNYTFGLLRYMPVKCEYFSKLKPV